MATLLESGARPYGSSRGVMISMVLHGALIAAAVFATTKVVLPPREKVEEHPILYVAAPPPKPIEAPKPLPEMKKAPPSQSKQVFKAPPAAPRVRTPQPAPQVAPKVPTTPALVAPTKIAVNIPAPDLSAVPTVSDVVAPPTSEPPMKGGVSSGGSVNTSNGDVSGGGKGLGSGSSGKAYDENQVDKAVQIQRAAQPRYPDALRSVGVEGVVSVRFIVSADGKVEPGSIEVLSTPNKLFGEAVRSALLNSKYRPAEAGGERVRQLVEQSFTFSLTK